MRRAVLAVLAIALAAACTPTEQPTYRDLDRLARRQQSEAISRPPPDTCQMAQHQSLIGSVGGSIDQSTLPAGSRIICHNCPVTLDFRAERLNVELGADGKVIGLRCG